jgi:hypothetical protein
MTDNQRKKFFKIWWPACCEVQGWDHKSEKRRREFVFEATKGATDRLSLCTQAQLTAVFQLCWHKSNPDSLNEAIPVANPEQAAEADEQRRCVFALLKKGLTRPAIERIAAPLCRKHRVGNWERLPSKVLKEMMRWKQFTQPAQPAPLLPLACSVTRDGAIEYELRPPPPTKQTATADCPF